MKKVLILGMTSIVGGVETFIMNLYKHIDKTKFQIDFLVLGKLEGQYREELSKDKNVKIFEVEHMKRHPIKAIKKIFKIYKDNKYDIIHMNINSSTPVLYTLPSKFYNKNVKIIAHSHYSGSKKTEWRHYIFRPLLNIQSDYFCACSKTAGEYMFGKKIANSTKLKLINNAIVVKDYIYDEQTRNFMRKEFNLEDNFVIGHIGRFCPEKNHEFLIEILKPLVEKNPKIKLVLLGVGEKESFIKQKVKDYNLENNVLFLGIRKDVNKIYQAFDIFVFPSIKEGLGVAGVEAQASGLICLFSDTITKEIDISGNCKFLPLEKDIWVKEIENLKAYDRKNMEIKIKNEKYDINDTIDEIEKIYML